MLAAGVPPEDVIRAVLSSWMEIAAPQITQADAIPELKANASVIRFADWLLQGDVITGAFWLSSAYTSLIGPAHRKANAMYFTPPFLTSRLLDNVQKRGDMLVSGKLIDPACGGGAFLAPAAQRIAQELRARRLSADAILRHIESNLYGCDTSEFLCFLSESFLRMVLAELIEEAGRSPRFNIVTGDGLTQFDEQRGEFSLVLCNPPYRKMTQAELAPYVTAHKTVLNGQPNLYSLFMHRATQLLRPTGVAALVTPMSYLSGRSFLGLRSVLMAQGEVQQLDLIHEKCGIFLLAEQDTVLTVWTKGTGTGQPTEAYYLTPDGGCEIAGSLTLGVTTGPWPVPRCGADAELLPLFSAPPASLATYAYRPKTGAIVVHRDPRQRYKTEEAGTNAAALVPLIWSKNISPEGQLNTDRVARNCTAKYVDLGSLDSPCVIKRPAVVLQRVSTDSQPRRLVCAPVPDELMERFGGVTGENHVGFLEQIDPGSSATPELLALILGTKTIDRLFRCISGATNVSAYELLHLPLPDIDVVQGGLASGFSADEAVRIGFGLSVIKPFSSQCSKPQDGQFSLVQHASHEPMAAGLI